MSYSDIDGDIVTKAKSRYVRYVTPAVFTKSGGAVFGTGSRFLSSGGSGSINVTTAGGLTALLVNRGQDGKGYYSGASGGNGGPSWIITGIFAVGTYTITFDTVYNASSSTVTITPTTGRITDLTTSNLYAGGVGGLYTGGIAHAGGNGSTFPSPFNIVLVGGGGGSGAAPGKGGYAGTERTGGAVNYTSIDGQPASTGVSGCGCGGGGGGFTNPTAGIGGTGGSSGCFILPAALSFTNNVIDSTTVINASSYAISTTVSLTNLLDNYCPVSVNPNAALYSVACIPSIESYYNSYNINGASIVDSYASAYFLTKHPFIITGTSGSYSINYYSGYYTIIFNVDGTYTFVPSSSLVVDVYLCSAGGGGGTANTVYSGGGGGSGAPIRGTFTSQASLTCILGLLSFPNIIYKCLGASGGYIQATSASDGGSAGYFGPGAAGSTGTATSSVVSLNPSKITIPTITSGTVNAATLDASFNLTGGGYTMYVTNGAAGSIGFGGAGVVSSGGKYGKLGVYPNLLSGTGYGAGGGGGGIPNRSGGTGARGVIILSFQYTFT
jgi:hypothetical protein